MENCTLYSHQTDFEQLVEIVKRRLPTAEVEYHELRQTKSLQLKTKGGLFQRKKSLTINYRERQNPSYTLEKINCAVTENLAGMLNFVRSIPLANRSLATQLAYKIESINAEISFVAEPGMNQDFMDVLQEVANSLDTIAFVQPSRTFNQSPRQHFLDSSFNLLTDVAGQSGVEQLAVKVDTKYFDPASDEFTEEQLDRRHESEKVLLDHGIKVNWHLPCLPALSLSRWRSLEEIIDRVYALLVIAALGEGVESTTLDRIIQEKAIKNFSPWEEGILAKSSLTDQEKVLATWRYESLFVLLWAIGKFPVLHFPGQICDVQAVVGLLMGTTREAFTSSAQLRDEGTLLSARDLTYRMNWAGQSH